jgi:hypothetical protein
MTAALPKRDPPALLSWRRSARRMERGESAGETERLDERRDSLAQRPSTWTEIKKQLSAMESKELIGLIQELYKLSPNNKNFLSSRFASDQSRALILEAAKEKIRLHFFPKRGYADPKPSFARQVIRDFKKTTSDFSGLIDLMLAYVEVGTEFTRQFGDMYESYYNSLVSAAEEVAKMLQTPFGLELYPHFRDRWLKLRQGSERIGWGYGSAIQEIVNELETRFSESEARSEGQ